MELRRVAPGVVARAYKQLISAFFWHLWTEREARVVPQRKLATQVADDLIAMADVVRGDFASAKESRALLADARSDTESSAGEFESMGDLADHLIDVLEEHWNDVVQAHGAGRLNDLHLALDLDAIKEVVEHLDTRDDRYTEIFDAPEEWAQGLEQVIREVQSATAAPKKAAPEPSFAELAKARKARTAPVYSPSASYAKGDYLLHKKFGLGWVADAGDRITVVFADGKRVLAHTKSAL